MHKILITGNMGYVGPVLVKHLRKSIPEAVLIGLDTGYFGNCITGSDILPECRVDLQYFADVRQFAGDILNDVDAVVHLAGISNDPIGNLFEQAIFDINYRASVKLAAQSRARGVGAFVFASSCSMYGAADDTPRTEDSPLNPLTAYAKSKVLTEGDLRGMAGSAFKVTSLRFSTACGMSDRLRLDLVLNDFVAGALASGRITILSDGTPWRPLVNVKDMARAIEWAIERNPADGGDFLAVNVGSDGWNYQVKELAEAVARIIPGVEISINKNAQPDKRSYKVSFGLFRQLAPDHQPQLDLRRSIEDLRDGLESMGFRDPEFRNSDYMRLKVLSQLLEKGLLDNDLKWARR
ncbi:MAG: SDR family oxidoreductase [Syntrophobacteraceae bacterium]|jgi:nucleoside-diphosphate-sugar epimerase